MTRATPPFTPPVIVSGGDRLASLDFTRGIAVMGIVFANVIAFGQPMLAYLAPAYFLTPPQPNDTALWLAQFVLVDGKFRGLFTLLFGAGLVLFAERATQRGANAFALQARRLGWLLAFGLAHYFLLWRGDILTLYALCGMLVLSCVDWPVERLFGIGLAGYLAGTIQGTAFYGSAWARSNAPGAIEDPDGRREFVLNTAGTYADRVGHTVTVHGWEWLTAFTQSALETMPLMLLGMALFKAGLFSGGIAAARQVRWGWLGLLAGTVLTLALGLWVVRGGLTLDGALFAFYGLGMAARLSVILGIAALLAAWGAGVPGWWRRRVTAAGRAAFSNYIGTSIVMLFVFTSAGAGLFGALDRIALYTVAAAVCALMLAWSSPWLARCRFGPLEWLWRCLTYGRWFPLRR